MKYPRFFAFLLTVIIAYLVFSDGFHISRNFDILTRYLASFTLGVLYTYGFTSPFATGALIIVSSAQQNIILTGIIAGFGSLIGDLIIFRFIRSSFKDELKKLEKEKLVKWFREKIKKYSSLRFFVLLIGCIIIASPLPDELGVTLIASYKEITQKWFIMVSYLLNTIGILTILFLGRVI